MFTELYGLETVALRYFNVYGPRQRPDATYAAVIPLFVDALLNGRDPVVHGDGLQSRDFTYISDVVAANLAAASAPAESCAGRVYNIAGGTAWTLLDVLARARRAARRRAAPALRRAPRRRRAPQPRRPEPRPRATSASAPRSASTTVSPRPSTGCERSADGLRLGASRLAVELELASTASPSRGVEPDGSVISGVRFLSNGRTSVVVFGRASRAASAPGCR